MNSTDLLTRGVLKKYILLSELERVSLLHDFLTGDLDLPELSQDQIKKISTQSDKVMLCWYSSEELYLDRVINSTGANIEDLSRLILRDKIYEVLLRKSASKEKRAELFTLSNQITDHIISNNPHGPIGSLAAKVINAIDIHSNSSLLYGNWVFDALMSGKLSISRLIELSELEAFPDAIKKEQEELDRRKGQHIDLVVSDLYKCPNCKSRSSITRQVQMASGDEATSLVCVCTICSRSFFGC